MIDASGKPNPAALPARDLWAIERLCEEFEVALQSGGSAPIEPYLARIVPELRSALLEHLLALELAYLSSRGAQVDLAIYVDRFPQDRAAVERAAARFKAGRTDTASFAGQSTSQRARVGGQQVLLPGARIGKFEVLEHLGQGGFGDVYRCRDTQLQREVALKLPRAGTLASREDVERFLREARAAAQLSHPHIVPVYESGEVEGRPFIASKFIAGRSLRRAILEGQRWGTAGAAKLIALLASALHDAHLRGIFHRDVKPENVMLDDMGRPFLMDFGLARRMEGETLRTQEGLQLGTPAYMSPEQAEGRSHLADARSDQWALGVMFYELLVGRRPFRGALHQVLAAIAQEEPDAPRSVVSTVPLDLETISLKCLQKSPEQRYPSCQHVAEEIERWQRGDAIEARPASWWETCERQVRRYPLVAGAGLLTVLAAIAGAVYWQTRAAYLDVRVTPATAKVKIGGEEVPLTNGRAVVSFAPGRHVLAARAEDYVSDQREVTLVRGSENTAVVQIDLRSGFGYLRANSEPPGASVDVLDAAGRIVAQGTTPFHSPRVRAGAYTLTFSKPLFTEAQAQASAPDGDRVGPAALVRLAPSVSGADSYEQLIRLMQALDRPIRGAWDFVETPLADATQFIADQERISIAIDERSLADVGIGTDSPVTIQVEKGTLRESLRDLLKPLELTFHPELRESGLRIEILTPEEVEGRLQTVVHPVDGIPAAERGDFDSLIDQLTASIEPTAWDEVGGPGSVSMVESPPSLVISQSWQVHFQVHHLLSDLRRKAAQAGRPRTPPVVPGDLPWQPRGGPAAKK